MSVNTTAWIELAQSLGEREFLARHPGFFLLSSHEAAELSTLHGATEIDSGPIKIARRKFEVRWIRRTHDSKHPDRITVGRAGDCDVSFIHSSVSKLHAYFCTDADRLTVTDLRSRNGTRVNGVAVAPNRATDVSAHDGVQFGKVQAMVLDAHELFAVLLKMV
jgi:hypothetical protein